MVARIRWVRVDHTEAIIHSRQKIDVVRTHRILRFARRLKGGVSLGPGIRERINVENAVSLHLCDEVRFHSAVALPEPDGLSEVFANGIDHVASRAQGSREMRIPTLDGRSI